MPTPHTTAGQGRMSPAAVTVAARAALAAVAFALLALGHPASALAGTATADDRAGFGVVPARGQGVDERAFFSYTLTPGSVAYDKVALVNYGTSALTLRIAALDAFNTAEGGFALAATGDRPQDLGGWVRLADADGTVTVPGRSSAQQPGTVVVPLSITVPADAEPGDHGGGVVAILRTEGRNPQGQNIDLEQRVAARVYVTVDGRLRPGLTVSELDARFTGGWTPWSPGRVDARYSVVNTGNVRLGVRSSVRTAGPFGVGTREASGTDAAELLPHNEQAQAVRVESVWPFLRTTVTVTARPLPVAGAPAPDLDPVSRSITLWTVPPWMPVGLVLLLALGAAGFYRQKHPKPRGTHAAGAKLRRPPREPESPSRERQPVGAGR